MRKNQVLYAIVLLFTAILIFLLGCGGGTKIQMPKGGVKLSYKNAIGKTFHYRTRVDKYIQTSQQGATITRLVKGDVKFTISVEEGDSAGEVKMKYRFENVDVGVFQNDQLQSSEEVEDMKDLEITATLDSEGTTIDVEGLDLEEELQKEEISPLEFLLEFPLPQEKVTVGYSWHEEKDTVVTDEDMKIDRKVVQNFLITDFVMLDSARVVVCKLTGSVDIHQVGETEQDGTPYDVDITMTGDIKGEVYFDIDNGCIVKQTSDKMIDIKGSQINEDTGEKQPISYYNQEKFQTRLEK